MVDDIASYEQALRRAPDDARSHYNLGTALARAGRLEEAIACLERAAELNPRHAGTHNNLGETLRRVGRFEEAIARLRQAIQLSPQSAPARNNLGNALFDQGRAEEALACYRIALQIQPTFAEALNNLGNALHHQGLPEQAEATLRQALQFQPGYVEAHNNLGLLLRDQNRLEEAHACFKQALRLKPDYVDAHNNLGTVLLDLNRLEEAGACFQQALCLKSDHVEAHDNLALVRLAQGQREQALYCYREALRCKPDHAEAHFAQALVWLSQGNWQAGWPEYEWRLQLKVADKRTFDQPRWDGGSLEDQTILLHTEQGLGDTLQFIRYASLLKSRGATVLIECQPPLGAILSSCPGIDRVLERGARLPDFDVQSPLPSVPGILRTSVADVPAPVPYLFPREEQVQQWRSRLNPVPGFKVGIAWQGNPKYRNDRRRSVPLAAFAPLAKVPGVRLYSLQKGHGVDQLTSAPFALTDLGSELKDFADTAALVSALDLVVSIDSAVAHLAGALGAPTWVALPFVPDWRWLLGRDDSPWYPTMRLFRQQTPGAWDEVFTRIALALETTVGRGPRPVTL
jgi:tetratricopeptide (TPR) repeat protein